MSQYNFLCDESSIGTVKFISQSRNNKNKLSLRDILFSYLNKFNIYRAWESNILRDKYSLLICLPRKQAYMIYDLDNKY